MAMAKTGLDWYNFHLEKARARAATKTTCATPEEILTEEFKDFPNDCETPRRQGLVFFQYRLADGVSKQVHAAGNAGALPRDVDVLVAKSILTYKPMVYEKFLTISAAGISQSNLDRHRRRGEKPSIQLTCLQAGYRGRGGKVMCNQAVANTAT
jgi:uncharacterized glyoxalase superfamily metalloenzyme YdcJ